METSPQSSTRCFVFPLGDEPGESREIDCNGKALQDIAALPAFVRDEVERVIREGNPTYQIIRSNGHPAMEIVLQVPSPGTAVFDRSRNINIEDTYRVRAPGQIGGGGWQTAQS